jgi:multiple sugar transport system permease protein
MFDLPYGMIGPGKYRVETLSVFAYQEAAQTRYGPAAAYAIVLFIYVLLVAFLFVRILGAEVVGDADVQKKKKKGEPPSEEAALMTTIGEGIGGAH